MKTKYSFSIYSFLLLVVLTGQLKATTYFYQSGAVNALASWNTAANGSGSQPTTFGNAGDIWNFHVSSGSATLSTNWPISSSAGTPATINIGSGSSSFSLTLTTSNPWSSNARVFINNQGTIIDNGSFLQNSNTGRINPQSGSTIVYGGNSVVQLNTSYHNLIIDNSSAFLNASPITVNGLLTINTSMALSINSRNLILNGGIAGAGELLASNGNDALTLNASSGNFGSLNFQAGSETLKDLTVALGTGTVSIVTPLQISGGNLTLTSGVLSIASRSLQVMSGAAVNFAGATIAGSSTSSLEIDGSITGNLSMASGANDLGTLILNSSGNTLNLSSALNVYDAVTVTSGVLASGGNLTLKASSPNLIARAGPMGASGSITGNVTVESAYIGGGPDWSLLGSNGVIGVTIGNWDGQIPITCTGCTYDPTSLSPAFYSVQGWDEPSCDFNTGVSSSTGMTPGTGFWVYAGASGGANLSWSFTGNLKQGAFSVGITNNPCTSTLVSSGANDGMNLVANPYASPISATSLVGLNTGNISSTVYYYLKNGGTGGYNTALGAPIDNGGTDDIAAGQGFYVQATGGTSLSFDETIKSTNNTSGLWRAGNKPGFIRMRLTGQYDKDDAIVSLVPDATMAYDPQWDSYKVAGVPNFSGNGLYTHLTSLSTLSSKGEVLSANCMPPSSNSMVIPMMAHVSVSGTYTLSVAENKNYGSCAVIRDKVTNIYHDLSVSPYVFNINDTTNVPRFELIVCQSGGGVVSVNELYASSDISIAKDNGVPVVTTSFDKPTDAVISLFNVIGQKLTPDVKVSGSQTTTRFDNLDLHNQVLLIKVTTGNQTVTKKLVVE